MKSSEVCKNCKYWDRKSKFIRLDKKKCRYNSPHLEWSYSSGGWPLSAADDWCGRFEEEEEE